MATKYVVDAHALVWYLEDNPRLGKNAKVVLGDRASELVLPIVALAEACWVVEKGRSKIPSVTQLVADVEGDSRIAIVPIDKATLVHSLQLTQLEEMHDRWIVATAVRMVQSGVDLAILTKDENIHNSGFVRIVW